MQKFKTILLFLLATVLPLILFMGMNGVDNLYMYAHGKDMLENGLVRIIDIFSMHDDFSFSYQKWIPCMMTYLIVSCFGWTGFTVATYLLFFLLSVGLWLFAKKFNPDHMICNTILIMICNYSWYMNNNLQFRPHVISGFLFLYLFYILEQYAKNKLKVDYLFYARFALISILFMWIHSTMWIVWILPFLPYVCHLKKYPFGSYFENRTYRLVPLFKAMGVMFLSGICNPNGIKQFYYMFVCFLASGEKYKHVSELQVMPFFPYISLLGICLIILFFIVCLISGHYTNIYMPSLYLIIGSLLLPLFAFRLGFYSYLFVTVACFLQMQYIYKDLNIKPYKLWLALGLVTCVVLVVFSEQRSLIIYFDKMALVTGTGDVQINEAVDWLYEKDSDAVVFNTTEHVGSYCIYKGLKPYIDCRQEVYDIRINQSIDILSELHDFENNLYHGISLDAGGIQMVEQSYQPDYYVLTEYSVSDMHLKKALEDAGADLIWGSPLSSVWIYFY